MSRLIPQVLKDAFQRVSGSEKRVTFVGTWGSGKTTALACLYLTCESLSSTQPNFKYLIVEKTSGIRQAPSDLRRGRFPEPTPPGMLYEADIIMKWEGQFEKRIVRLPFCETAGEDIQKLIGRFSRGMYRMSMDWRAADTMNKYICESNGYVLVVPVSRALMFEGGLSAAEKEPQNLVPDPDVNIARILESIYSYKEQTRSSSIEGMAVLLTKYDIISPFAKSRGMDLYQPQGVQAFLNTYFPQTSALLKYHGMDKVRFFPVHVQVDRTDKGEFVKWPEGDDKILLDVNRRLPVYSEQSYLELIQWIKQTFS